MKDPASIAIAVFDSHDAASDAVIRLQHGGFDMTKVSIVGRGYQTEEHVLGFFNAGDRAKFFGKYGALWGTLAGVLFSAAFMVVPVVGGVVVLGPLASAIVGAVEGAVVGGGVSALAGALSALGVPKDTQLRYETDVRADKYLLVVHGDTALQQHAKDLLASTAFESFAAKDASGHAADPSVASATPADQPARA